MIAQRPSIFIYTKGSDPQYIKQICAGIEEEGVFYEIFEKNSSDVSQLAYDAANESMMGSGIGVSGDKVALMMKGVVKGNNVEFYRKASPEECRRIGANSARIIKKMPLK